MAHARRYFVKSQVNDREGSNQALSMFQALYEIEQAASELDLDEENLNLMREQESVPLLARFHDWLRTKPGATLSVVELGSAGFLEFRPASLLAMMVFQLVKVFGLNPSFLQNSAWLKLLALHFSILFLQTSSFAMSLEPDLLLIS